MLSVVFFLIVYAVIGLAALTLAMRLVPPNRYFGFVTPRCLDSTELWYTVMTSVYAFVTGLTYAGFTAFVLEAMGMGAAATKFSLYASLSNTPIASRAR